MAKWGKLGAHLLVAGQQIELHQFRVQIIQHIKGTADGMA